jgi:hypothetical protein
MTLNRNLLELRFQAATGCKPYQAKNHTNKYLQQCALAMVQDNFSDNSGSNYRIYLDKIRAKLDHVVVSGQAHPVLETFDSFSERIFDYVSIGNNLKEKITMAHARYTMEEVILAAGNPDELAVHVYEPFATEIAHEEYDLVPIDMQSMANYIRSNLSQDRDNPRTPSDLREEWDRNLKHAQKIWVLATASGNQLMQIRNESQFGRRYYKGPNLQNTPKMVRHAALGNCHEYDIESSVFAWKLSWFRAICRYHNTSISMPATLEYLDHKRALRKRLAQTVFDTRADWAVNVVKEFVTAIGFGAPMRGDGYVADGRYQKPALAQIITAKTRLNRALADPWVQEFVQEQKDMNEAIVALAKVNIKAELDAVPELWEKGSVRKLKPNSVVSYLYQHAEREILDWAEQFCADSEVLLTVHDCIYTRQAVDLAEFRAGVQAFGEFFRLGHETHRAYTWQDPVLPSDPFYDPRDAVVNQGSQQLSARTVEGLYDGGVYTGTDSYEAELDPFVADLDLAQQHQYRLARQQVLPPQDTVRQMLGL